MATSPFGDLQAIGALRDRRLFATVAASFITCAISLPTTAAEPEMPLTKLAVGTFAFSPDGTLIACAERTKQPTSLAPFTIGLWNIKTQKKVWVFTGDKNTRPHCVTFSPDGKRLAVSDNGGTVKFWSLIDHTLSSSLEAHKLNAWSIAFSPNGEHFASTSADGTTILRNAKTLEVEAVFEHDRAAWGLNVCFSPDSQSLAVGCTHGSATLWNVKTKKRMLLIHDTNATCSLECTFSSGGKTLAVGGTVEMAHFWDTGKLVNRRVLIHELPEYPISLAYTTDGKYIAATKAAGVLALYDSATGCLFLRTVDTAAIER